MTTEDFNKIINGMKEKLGNENTSKIADDLAILISDNANINKDLKTKDDTIQKLNTDKDTLINTNGKLLQQIAVRV